MEPDLRAWEHLHAGLDLRGLIGFPLAAEEREAWLGRYRATFWANVKRQTGEYVHAGTGWHAYSYGFEEALIGAAALAEYTARAARELLVYFEDEELFDCFGLPSPDLSDWGRDLYVFPRDLAWTMVFTHEQDTGLGPYFALAQRTPTPSLPRIDSQRG